MNKARFISDLVARWRGGYMWELTRPLEFYSAILDQVVRVPVGRATDLATLYRVPLAYWLLGSVADKAATIHDELYRRKDVPRRTADAAFLEAMAASGVPWWQRRLIHAAVRVGGTYADPWEGDEGGD